MQRRGMELCTVWEEGSNGRRDDKEKFGVGSCLLYWPTDFLPIGARCCLSPNSGDLTSKCRRARPCNSSCYLAAILELNLGNLPVNEKVSWTLGTLDTNYIFPLLGLFYPGLALFASFFSPLLSLCSLYSYSIPVLAIRLIHNHVFHVAFGHAE